MFKKSLFVLLIIIMISFISCDHDNEKDTGGGKKVPPPILLKIEIDNQSEFSLDYILSMVFVGADVLENIDEIFDDSPSTSFENFKENFGKEFVEREINVRTSSTLEDWIDPYQEESVSGKLENNQEGAIVYYFDTHHGCSSVMLRLNFDNDEERILAGWPKYYYSKLNNVVKYGFFYDFSYDKKILEYHRSGGSGYYFSIDSDEPSGKITGYPQLTIYSLKLTINSIDDIILEVDEEETGKEFEVIRDEIPEGMS